MGDLIRLRTKEAFQAHSTANTGLWKTEGGRWAPGEGEDGEDFTREVICQQASKDEPMELPVLKGGRARTQ